MVFAAKGVRLFQTQDVRGPFHDANDRGVTPAVGADAARVRLGQRPATRAEADAFARVDDELRELANGGRVRLHQMQGNALGGTGPDAGQFAERGGEGGDGFGKRGHE